MIDLGRRHAGAFCLLAAALVAGSLRSEPLPKDWRNWSHFRVVGIESAGEEDLRSVIVPEALFEHARSDLADVRLIDHAGAEVGYVLYSPGHSVDVEWREVAISDSGEVPEEYFQVVADTRGLSGDRDLLHDAVEVTLARRDEELFSWVEVAASDDRETWRIIRAKAPLYWFDEEGFRGPVTVRYPRTRDRWLRLRLRARDGEIVVAGLRVAEDGAKDDPTFAVRRGMTLRSGAPDGESWWEPYRSLPAMPIVGARFATEREEFHRPVVVSASDDGKVWRQIGRGHIYRIRSDDDDNATDRQALDLGVRRTTAPHWRVTVLDRGDQPISDLHVELLRPFQSIVFRPTSEMPYRVLYGNHRAEAPEYELAALTADDALASARGLKLGGEQTNEAYVSPEPFSERHPMILWLAFGLAAVALGALALKSLR